MRLFPLILVFGLTACPEAPEDLAGGEGQNAGNAPATPSGTPGTPGVPGTPGYMYDWSGPIGGQISNLDEIFVRK